MVLCDLQHSHNLSVLCSFTRKEQAQVTNLTQLTRSRAATGWGGARGTKEPPPEVLGAASDRERYIREGHALTHVRLWAPRQDPSPRRGRRLPML